MSEIKVINVRGSDQPTPVHNITVDEVEEDNNKNTYDLNINEGWTLEDRPISPGRTITMYYKGEHKDGCVKTEYGWICVDWCEVIERGSFAPTKKVEVDTLIEVYKNINKIRLFKYKWEIIRKCEVRTYNQGRSFAYKDLSKRDKLFESGISSTKFKAKRDMINYLDSNIPSIK